VQSGGCEDSRARMMTLLVIVTVLFCAAVWFAFMQKQQHTNQLNSERGRHQRAEEYSRILLRHNEPEPYQFRVSPAWTEDCANAWSKFLATTEGNMLRLRLQALVATVAIAGCKDAISTTHSAGNAAGWAECVDKLMEMRDAKRFSPVAGAPPQHNAEDPNGGGSFSERDRQSNEELLALLSP